MHAEHCQPCGKYISWNAVIGGALVALGLTFLFNLLTIALGLSLFTQNSTGKIMLTYGGFAWILIGIYIILFISGWVTGRIVSHRNSFHGATGWLNGFLTWTLYVIISLAVMAHMASDSAVALFKTTEYNIAIDEQTRTGQVESNSESSHASTNANPTNAETKSVHKTGISTFASFFIFLVGALGCCIGASYGIGESRKCHDECVSKKPMSNT